jgi:hypothetical protein
VGRVEEEDDDDEVWIGIVVYRSGRVRSQLNILDSGIVEE